MKFNWVRGIEMTRGVAPKNKPKIIERIIDGLWEGETLRSLCISEGIGDRTLRDWRRADDGLNEKIKEARLDGILAKLDKAEDELKQAMDGGDRNKILGADKYAAHQRWQAEKLLPLFQPVQKSQVEHSGPFILGWDDGPKAEEKKPDALSALATTTANGGEVRKH